MRLVATILLLLALGLTLRTPAVEACIHAPKDLEFPIEAGSQRGIVMWDNGREELVLMPGYKLADTKDGKSPEIAESGLVANFKSFAWLVPVPSIPDAYKETATTVFKDMHAFTTVHPRLEELKTDDGPVLTAPEETQEGMQFLEAVNIGEYSIQPIKAKGESGGKELNAWLKDKGFGEVSSASLRWYVKHDWCWLAVRMASDKGLPDKADVKPLQISFKTPRPVYPLKIQDGRGEFDAELWVIVRERLDLSKLRQWGLETPEMRDDYYVQDHRETGFAALPESVRAIGAEQEDFKALRLGAMFCYRISGKLMEAPDGQDVAAWVDDLYFEFEKDAAPKPKDEVKPTPPEEKQPEGDKPEGKSQDKPGDKKPEGKEGQGK
ncbi:MAG: DUF2330 domain-containing protein [Planctomycetes bacterium]|nr:DUF2330 domain-containing protein [Planctomycetota bacterium]